MKLMDWNIEELSGYKPITTFYTDFGIAEWYGTEGISETYTNIMEFWSSDYRYLTEFVMVLNWKMWEHHNKNTKLAKLYEKLFLKASNYAETHLTGFELDYYYRTID